MKVVKKGIMPDNTPIQIENWNEDYDFFPQSSTIAAYKKSKATLDGRYAPKAKKLYRFEFDFKNAAETEIVFHALLNGEKTLPDYKDKLYYPKYAECI